MVRVKLAGSVNISGRVEDTGSIVDVNLEAAHKLDKRGLVAEWLDDVDLPVGDKGMVHVRMEDENPDASVEASFDTQAEAIEYAMKVIMESDASDEELAERQLVIIPDHVPVDAVLDFIEQYDSEQDEKPSGKEDIRPDKPEPKGGDQESTGSDRGGLNLDPAVEELLDGAGYKTINDLRDVSVETLMEIKGIGKSRAEEIVKAAKEHDSQ